MIHLRFLFACNSQFKFSRCICLIYLSTTSATYLSTALFLTEVESGARTEHGGGPEQRRARRCEGANLHAFRFPAPHSWPSKPQGNIAAWEPDLFGWRFSPRVASSSSWTTSTAKMSATCSAHGCACAAYVSTVILFFCECDWR